MQGHVSTSLHPQFLWCTTTTTSYHATAAAATTTTTTSTTTCSSAAVMQMHLTDLINLNLLWNLIYTSCSAILTAQQHHCSLAKKDPPSKINKFMILMFMFHVNSPSFSSGINYDSSYDYDDNNVPATQQAY